MDYVNDIFAIFANEKSVKPVIKGSNAKNPNPGNCFDTQLKNQAKINRVYYMNGRRIRSPCDVLFIILTQMEYQTISL